MSRRTIGGAFHLQGNGIHGLVFEPNTHVATDGARRRADGQWREIAAVQQRSRLPPAESIRPFAFGARRANAVKPPPPARWRLPSVPFQIQPFGAVARSRREDRTRSGPSNCARLTLPSRQA